MKNLRPLLILAVAVLFASGCLTVEKKEYTFELNNDNSGTLTVKYINIMSIMDDGENVSSADFDELINDYIEGEEAENMFPDAELMSKRLFEENNQLCGEVIYKFNDLREIKLFDYSKKTPLMYSLCDFVDSEVYSRSNGEYGGENMPVVFWDKSLKELRLFTSVSEVDDDCVSLLPEYLEWKE